MSAQRIDLGVAVDRAATPRQRPLGLVGRSRYAESVATAVLVCVLAVYAGRGLADFQTRTFGLGHGSAFAFTLIALVLMAMLRAASFAGFVGLCSLAVLNGIPGMDVESLSIPGSLRVSDVLVVALIVVLATRQQTDDPGAVRAIRMARRWGIAFACWWAFTWIRTMLEGIPAIEAAVIGRDFLYFAILVPLVVGAFGRRQDIYVFLAVMATGTLIYEVAQIAVTALGFEGAVTRLFVHETLSSEVGGLHRIYAFMDYAVPAALAIGLGLAVSPVRRPFRQIGVFLAGISSISVLLGFTRATYLGFSIAILLVSAMWMRTPSPASVGLRRVSIAALGVVLALIISGGYRPLLNSGAPTEVVSSRAATTIEDLQQRSGTVQYRYELQKEMRRVLGPHWFEGLGFPHPAVRPVPTLPSGSIRNADLGVMNSVMTIGVFGTLFIYGPPLAMLVSVFKSRRRSGPAGGSQEWFLYGISVWLVYAVVSSLTLVTLFSVPGLVLTALLIGCAARLLTEDVRDEWSPS